MKGELLRPLGERNNVKNKKTSTDRYIEGPNLGNIWIYQYLASLEKDPNITSINILKGPNLAKYTDTPKST